MLRGISRATICWWTEGGPHGKYKISALKKKIYQVPNRIQCLLCSLGICDEGSTELFYPKVRDRDDIAVMKCKKSGVMFLSRSDHMEISHYENMQGFNYWSSADRRQAVLGSLEDNQRRCAQFQGLIANRTWLDVGTGAGGILQVLGSIAREVVAVEPQEQARAELTKEGIQTYARVEDVPDEHFEVVTLFHVFEHLTEPIETLETITRKMATGGRLIIEVPHAGDFLLSFLDLEEFKAFTFWSEHLILHTRQSLTLFLRKAGFRNIVVQGVQRYPLANHLHWLARRKPGGHVAWNNLRTLEVDRAYADLLATLDKTDTLIALAERP
jgi:2-polyprenyl-3-methyl-5-hydroxy-6-metoxy-1,4-benzoquinol methylase